MNCHTSFPTISLLFYRFWRFLSYFLSISSMLYKFLLFYMISIVCCVLVYYLGSLLVNYVFSVNLCGFVSLVSSNFECGFVSALSTYIRFRFSYWLVICNFIIFELELLISFVFIYSIASYCIYLVVIGLLLLLLFDLYLD